MKAVGTYEGVHLCLRDVTALSVVLEQSPDNLIHIYAKAETDEEFNRLIVENTPSGVIIKTKKVNLGNVVTVVTGRVRQNTEKGIFASLKDFFFKPKRSSINLTKDSVGGRVVHGDLVGGSIISDMVDSLRITLELRVQVPANVSVKVRDVFGDIDGGDFQNNFDLECSSVSDIRLGKILTSTIRATGSGDIRIGNVQGDLEVDMSSVGNVDVGTVFGSLTADVSGTGDLYVEAVNGGDVSIDLSSVGSVTIDGGSFNHLEVESNGTGDVTVNGSAASANLESNSVGSIDVESVTGRLRTRANSVGDVKAN